MKFSIIIPTKDRKQIITKSLARLNQVRNVDDLELIVINDSSEELVLDDFHFDQFQIVKNPGSGVASARNLGASLAKNDWLIFMDDDMWVQPDTFLKLEPLIQKKENSCFNINWIYPEELTSLRSTDPFLRYLKNYGFDSLEGWSNDPGWRNDHFFEVTGITSQFFIIHRNLFHKIGGYNEKFPFAGFEDHDLSKRLRAAQVPIILDPTNLIFHNEEDRIQVENWLERKWRGAYTRKVAVSLGYDELKLSHSATKSTFHRLIFKGRRPLLNLLKRWTTKQKRDAVYFFLVNRLFGAYAFDGYSKKINGTN